MISLVWDTRNPEGEPEPRRFRWVDLIRRLNEIAVVILVAGKLTGEFQISWTLALSPVWVPACLAVIVGALGLVVGLLIAAFQRR